MWEGNWMQIQLDDWDDGPMLGGYVVPVDFREESGEISIRVFQVWCHPAWGG